MSVEENKKVVFGFVEALLNGDIEAARATLADDATWWIPGSLPVSGTHYGKKAIFDDFMSRVPFQPGSVSIQIRNALGEGEFVAVEWTTRAKTIKGSDYENSYNYLFEIRNGKI